MRGTLHSRYFQKSQAGFTLLELIVVLAIVVITLSMSIVFFSEPNTSQKLKRISLALSVYLQETRSTAIHRNKALTFSIDPANKVYWREARREVQAFPKSIMVSAVTAKLEQGARKIHHIRFLPDGSTTGGSVTLSEGDITMVLHIDWLTGATTLNEQTARP